MKKGSTAHQRLLASARKALAARNVVTPVPAFNARAARIDQAGKRARRNDKLGPTPEQAGKATYLEAEVNDYVGGRRVRVGNAYRRQPRFETIAGITVAQLFALRHYRRAFDVSELSATKSCLDVGPGGGGTGGAETAISRLEALAFADHEVRRIEATIAAELLPVLRAVALHDMDFKAVADEVWGSTSGKRREQVRATFLRGADALARRAKPAAASAPAGNTPSTPSPPPAINPAFLDERGMMRPMEEIVALILGGFDEDAGEGACIGTRSEA